MNVPYQAYDLALIDEAFILTIRSVTIRFNDGDVMTRMRRTRILQIRMRWSGRNVDVNTLVVDMNSQVSIANLRRIETPHWTLSCTWKRCMEIFPNKQLAAKINVKTWYKKNGFISSITSFNLPPSTESPRREPSLAQRALSVDARHLDYTTSFRRHRRGQQV